MSIWSLWVLDLVGILCTSRIEKIIEEVKKRYEKALSHELSGAELEIIRETVEEVVGLDTKVLIPFVFHGRRLVISPVTRHQDIEQGEREYVEKVVKMLPILVWNSITCIYVPGDSDWTIDLMNEIFKTTSFEGFDPVTLYKRTRGKCGMRFTDVVMRTFRHNIGMLNRFGQRLAQEAGAKIQEISSSLSDEEKRKEEKMLQIIKEYGESLCTKEKQEEIIKAQEIVCDVCTYIWRRPEDRASFLIEAYSRYLHSKTVEVSKHGDIDEPLFDYVDHCSLVSTYEKYKSMDIVGELFLRVFLEGKDINDESVNDTVCGVREREEAEKMRGEEERRKKEEESLRNTLELLRMEEKEKSKGRGKKKKGGKKGSGEVTAKMEEEKKDSEEVEESAEAEVSLEEMAVGGARSKERSSKKKSRSKGHRYKVHKRVLRWTKSAERIKAELDEGSEEKWRNKSIEEIEEQKKVHDIIEVCVLLRSLDANRFFVSTNRYMKDGTERWKMVGVGIFEEGGEKKVGKVEVGLYRDKGEGSVIYHLMFKAMDTEKAGKGAGSSFGKGDDVDGLEEEGAGELSDMSGFEYPKGVRSEIVKGGDAFKIVYRNPKDTSEVLRSLTVLQKAEVL
ncbi:DUF1609 domain-containing protein [Encephalitozoon cuniculi]|nr:DUF1609 domain-containing protein [Encephalitozoon cuniculi]